MRAIFKTNLLDVFRVDRERVDLVGHSHGRLHGGNVRVDEHGADALLLESLQGLGTRVVELTSLTNRKT